MRFDKLAQYALATAGVLALGFCMEGFLESYLYEATEARNFDRALHIREESKGKSSDSFAPVAPAMARLSDSLRFLASAFS